MNTAQQTAIPAATAAIIAKAIATNLTINNLVTAEHADGSGRWHIIATACTRHGKDTYLRALINADGTTDNVLDITNLYA